MIVAIRVLTAVAALIAAALWLRSALIDVPDNSTPLSASYSVSAAGTAWPRSRHASPHSLLRWICFTRRCSDRAARRRYAPIVEAGHDAHADHGKHQCSAMFKIHEMACPEFVFGQGV
jgi:hypothetical protein